MFTAKRGRAFARARKTTAVRRALHPVLLLAFLGAASLAAGTFVPMSNETDQAASVTRGQTDLIVLPDPIPNLRAEPVSIQLRTPVRVATRTAQPHDIGDLVRATLAQFEPVPEGSDRLYELLVQTLSEGQSDAYINAVLNASLGRGEYTPPSDLIAADGRLDTPFLLSSILERRGG